MYLFYSKPKCLLLYFENFTTQLLNKYTSSKSPKFKHESLMITPHSLLAVKYITGLLNYHLYVLYEENTIHDGYCLHIKTINWYETFALDVQCI